MAKGGLWRLWVSERSDDFAAAGHTNGQTHGPAKGTPRAMTERAGRRCCLGWDFSTQQVRAGRGVGAWRCLLATHALPETAGASPRNPVDVHREWEVTPGVHAEEESGLRVAGTQDTQRKQQSPQAGGGVRAC